MTNMIFIHFLFVGLIDGFGVIEDDGINTRSVRYNESCDALGNSKLCEEECGDEFQNCFITCEDQGKR